MENSSLVCDDTRITELVDVPSGVISFASLIPNLLVLVTFWAERRRSRVLPQGSVQLCFLAISDLLYGILMSVGLLWLMTSGHKTCTSDQHRLAAFTFFLYLFMFTNRHLTSYIAFTRARTIFSLRQAQMALAKTEREHFWESLLYGCLPMIILGSACGALKACIIAKLVVLSTFWKFFLFYATAALAVAWTIVVLVSAIYIVYKTKKMLLMGREIVEVQKMVSIVALVFVVCQIPLVVKLLWSAYQLHTSTTDSFKKEPLIESVQDIFEALNSAANFFIYILVGRNFRNSFKKLFKCK